MQANQPFVCIDPAASPVAIVQQLRTFDVTLLFVASSFPAIDVDFMLCHTITDLLDSTVYVYRRRLRSTVVRQCFRLPIMFGVCTSGSTGDPKALAVPVQCFMPNVSALE